MGDHVFPVLKFGHDSLQNGTLRSCFLYLAVFQEDYVIIDNDLINLWIGEGFLDEFDNLNEARNQGHNIIEHLNVACLFESDDDNRIKIHDNKIVVEKDGTLEAQQILKWKEVKRISLWDISVEKLAIPPSCPNLITLIFGSVILKTFPYEFFHLMPIIKVLDLSGTQITELPVGIDRLVTLQYLNLSYTKLRKLPTELKSLIRIRCFILDGMPHLKTIPKEEISKLSSLKLFSMQVEGRDHFSQDLDMELNYSLEEGKKAHCSSKEEEAADLWEAKKANYLWQDNKALFEELAGLEHINEVSFPIEGALSFEKLMRSQKLQNAMRCLSLGNLDG
ncbi:hypothetical protein PVL29_011380 [Vitis rotundifolia]|uniref:Disease resistance protein winged helix domain-containing protein n=1 Tax=Vitis rotundifolia TaxID=103349 RepID=A0AA38ZQ13_VITRO|nr:hypothetical protein PVL29_011380 [Vitis rotundifolia]